MLDALTHRSMTPVTSFRIEVTSDIGDLADCWPTTAEHGEAHCYPFQYADLLRIWCETIGRARQIEPVFVAVRSHGQKPLMLLAFGIERTNGVRILSFLDGGVSDYNAPVLFPDVKGLRFDAADFWQRLQPHLPSYDLALLEKMPAEIDGIANPLAPLATCNRPESCHHVTLQGEWKEFEAKKIPSLRDSRRRQRNLEKRANIRFSIADTHQERQRVFDALVRMKRKRFADTAAHDIFADPGYLQFYADATRKLGPGGAVQVSALYAGDRVIAANWGLYSNGHYIDLVPGYEAGEWRPFAPGRLLAEWLLRQHLERGDTVFDYGIGDEPYKFGYCDQHSLLGDAYLPVTAKGIAYNRLLQLQLAAKAKLRETRIGPALKAARSLISRITQSRTAPVLGDTAPAWVALIGSVSLAIDV
ncbi:MAG TPA: GNAT family N-acetyltransferase [Xanthobacteraceae bacterium]|nr:GNAT family N-acetyltransferase [Xanthobacteraceae bacterium]